METCLCVAYILLMVAGVIFNISIIFTFLSGNVRRLFCENTWWINYTVQVILSTQNVLILNLCIADILLILFNMPLTWMELNKIYWETSFKGLVQSKENPCAQTQ